MDDQMTPDGYANFDNEECTSLPEINPDKADCRGAFIEACINGYVTEKEVEVLSRCDDNDENCAVKVQKQLNCDQL